MARSAKARNFTTHLYLPQKLIKKLWIRKRPLDAERLSRQQRKDTAHKRHDILESEKDKE
jgi:hypothetical protein